MSNKKKIKQLNEKVDELINKLNNLTVKIRGSDLKLTLDLKKQTRGN